MAPSVTVITLLTERRQFIDLLTACINLQDYDRSSIEWLIVDDSGVEIPDFKEAAIQPLYVSLSQKQTLGRKRNIACSIANGEFITFFDDDDIHFPGRITAGIEALTKRGQRFIAGSSEMEVVELASGKIYKDGPYNSKHATAGTFFFRKQMLEGTSFRDSDVAGEEAHFLKNYSIPMHQLKKEQSIICIGHEQNTVSKKKFYTAEKFSGNIIERELPSEIMCEFEKLQESLNIE